MKACKYALPKSAAVTIPSPQFQQYTLAHIPAAATARLPCPGSAADSSSRFLDGCGQPCRLCAPFSLR
jgi:hypothetical protein